MIAEKQRGVKDRKVECFVSYVWNLDTVFTFFFDCFLCIYFSFQSFSSTPPSHALSSPPPPLSHTKQVSRSVLSRGKKKKNHLLLISLPFALFFLLFSSCLCMLNTYQQHMPYNPCTIHDIWAITSHTHTHKKTLEFLSKRILPLIQSNCYIKLSQGPSALFSLNLSYNK